MSVAVPGAFGPVPPKPAAAAVSRHINGMAIASFVLSLIPAYGVGSLLAIVLGHIARHQLRLAAGTQRGQGMALAGLILGYAGLAVFVVLLAVLAAVVATSIPHTPSF